MAAPEAKEIRDIYAAYRSDWQDIRDEANTDMRYVLGDPWDPKDREAREDAGRPCLSLDELNQYLNQYVNNLRQQRRAINVTAKGNGATDEDAKKRSSLIMGIEERSQAQGPYICAGQSAAERSYGFAVVRTEYKDFESFDQEILIKPVLNPDSILISPNYKQPDASDIPDGFILELMPRDQFKRQHPKAKITDFVGDAVSDASTADWIKEKFVQRGEYWRVEYDTEKLLLVQMKGGHVVIVKESEWKNRRGGEEGEVKRERDVQRPRVVQYLTNGLEILDEKPWAGTRIPICTCLGKEMWITEGGVAKRKLISMVRLARDPQMLFAFLATQECEEAGQIPKVPFVGYTGQFQSDEETWKEINKVPHAFVQVDPIPDGQGGICPLPQRPAYQPNFQQYELAKDSARRSIQAAFGIVPLPTAAQRSNQKSGIALDKIEEQEAIGSFHFADNFKRFLHNVGWQVNELITPIIDTQRDQAISKPDGTRTTLQLVGKTSHPIDKDGAYEVQGLDDGHLHTGKGDFDVTIGDGPSYASEREKQSDFSDRLLDRLETLPIPPAIAQKILALAIKMKNVGSLGDEIALLLNPPDPKNLPPAAQAIITQLQGQNQQLTQENSTLHMERAGRVLEQQTKIHLKEMDGQQKLDAKTIDYITQIVRAELAKGSKQDATKAQIDAQKELTQLGFDHDAIARGHEAAHEVAMSGLEHNRTKELAATAQAAQPDQAQPDTGAASGTPAE
jgi:hypothetical protein